MLQQSGSSDISSDVKQEILSTAYTKNIFNAVYIFRAYGLLQIQISP